MVCIKITCTAAIGCYSFMYIKAYNIKNTILEKLYKYNNYLRFMCKL